MKITSPAFENSKEIPQKHGKKLENISIPLEWKDAPKETKSFAISFIDTSLHPRYYIHWMIVDLPSNIFSIKEGASGARELPEGVKEIKPYVGPFPPSGTHNYEFTIYALKTDVLALPIKPTLEVFLENVNRNILASAKLVGMFTKFRVQ